MKKTLLRSGAGFTMLAVGLTSAFACSDEKGLDDADIGIVITGGTGSTPPDGSTGGSQDPPIVVNPPASNAGTGTTGSAGSGSLTNETACATGNAEAKLQPVNMFIQFDRSGSMRNDDKWTQAVNALTGFFEDPQTAGLRVALRFFPHNTPATGCMGGNDCDGPSAECCNVDACAEPLVPLGELLAANAPADTHERALIQALEMSAPAEGGRRGGRQSGGTPLWAALGGAVQWGVAHKNATPDEATVVVFVTDGEPNGCEEDISEIAKLASEGRAQGVPTYVIGIAGVSEESVDEIALAGGTEKAFFAGGDDPAQTQQELIAALNAIRGNVLSCTFPMPNPDVVGQEVDPAKINVNYTPGGTTSAERIGKSPDGNSCEVGGWYYDDPTHPTTISLCEADCKRITADPSARIDVLLGCAAVPAEPPH